MAMNQQRWSHIDQESQKTKFIWLIENFSRRYTPVGEKFTSTVFYSGKNDKDKWCLQMYPKGTSDSDKDSVHICLKLIRTVQECIRADVTISVVEPRTNETSVVRKTTSRLYFFEGTKFGVKNLIKSSEIPRYLGKDTLKISCEIIPTGYSNNLPEISSPELGNVASENFSTQLSEEPIRLPSRLCDQLWMQFQKSENTDTVIIVQDKRFHVHKFILQVRSPVFAAMFQHGIKGDSIYEIVIKDINSNVVRKMLQFIYTDKIDEFEGMVGSLFVAAHRYALDGLKALCEQVLCDNLTISNAIGTLILADSGHSDSLKNLAARFINFNLPEVINTSNYKLLEERFPNLVFYLVHAMATQMTKN